MKFTEEQCEKLSDIPADEVLKDIEDTQKEVDNLRVELNSFLLNPVINRLNIYVTEGKIRERVEFIENLNLLLKHRNEII